MNNVEQAKHTPGPWREHKKLTRDDTEPVILIRADAHDMTLAEVWVDYSTPEAMATDEANARLIAAAPELLRMVQVQHAELESVHGKDYLGGQCLFCSADRGEEHDEPCVLNQAPILIAKATGT